MADGSPLAEAIGARLRHYRRAKRLTQSELARGAFSKSYISQLENGSVTPSLQALSILADRLDTSVASLLEGDLTAAALLRGAGTYYALGELRQAEALLDRASASLDRLPFYDRLEALLLRVRLAADRADWEAVEADCEKLGEALRPLAHPPSALVVPHRYWWGKAGLVRGNRYQAVKRWSEGLEALGRAIGPPSIEGLRLLSELTRLYRQLGEGEAAERVAARLRAILGQLSTLESLCRWTLARRIEREAASAGKGAAPFRRREDPPPEEAFALEQAMSDTEAWARAARTLRLLHELRRQASLPPKGGEAVFEQVDHAHGRRVDTVEDGQIITDEIARVDQGEETGDGRLAFRPKLPDA